MRRKVLCLLCLGIILSALNSCYDDEIDSLSDRLNVIEMIELAPEVIRPAGIVVLDPGPICLELGERRTIEFRINPSNASLSTADEEEIELVCLGPQKSSGYFGAGSSENVRLVSIEHVTDSLTQAKADGHYRLTIEDRDRQAGYSELFALVLTLSKGTKEECQIVSLPFVVMTERLTEVDTGLPVVLVNTPGMQPVSSKEEWMEGASMMIVSATGVIEYRGQLSIKGRGNTSWGFPKKPYALKLDTKTELLGMAAHKRWCLLAGWSDRSLIRNAVAFELARQTGLDWTPSGQHIELVLNGQHMGNYYLCEQIRLDENRLNLQNPKGNVADRGYIFELDTYFDEDFKFRSPLKDLPYQFKDPSDVTPEQQRFMEQYVAEMENALYDSARFAAREFVQYLDLESFADYWLVYEIAQLWEPNHPKSVYLHKDAGGKIKAGPVWDFDMGCFKPRPEYFYVNRTALYYEQLFRDREFCQIVSRRFNQHRDGFLSVTNFIDSLGNQLTASQDLNYPMWPISIVSSGDETLADYPQVLARLKTALCEKIAWLDDELKSQR